MQKWIRTYAILIGVLAISLFALPLFAISIVSFAPTHLVEFLFYWPQYALAPYGFHQDSQPLVTVLWGSSMQIAIGFWLTFLALVATLVRNWSPSWVALVALPLGFVTVVLMSTILARFGLVVALDGP